MLIIHRITPSVTQHTITTESTMMVAPHDADHLMVVACTSGEADEVRVLLDVEEASRIAAALVQLVTR